MAPEYEYQEKSETPLPGWAIKPVHLESETRPLGPIYIPASPLDPATSLPIDKYDKSSHSPENPLYASISKYGLASTIYKTPENGLGTQNFPSYGTPSYFKIENPEYKNSLADKIFGRQLAQAGIHLNLESYATRQRTELQEQHLRQLESFRNKLINQLHFAKRPYAPSTPQQVAQLERLLFNLESETRKTEIDFWKDIHELSTKRLELAFDYRAMHDRHGLLRRAEAHND